jgi:FkbM family methyltransferase
MTTPTYVEEASTGMAENPLTQGLKILFVERRMPGVILRPYYALLERLGVDHVNLKTKNGLTVKCMTNARVVFIEVFEKDEYAFPDFDWSDKTVIDIGANQGFFTLYAASRGARVFSFEPLEENIAILRENVKRNGLEDRVTAFHAAVTGTEKEITLFFGENTHGNARSETASIIDEQRGGVSTGSRKVEGVPAAELLAHCGLDACDFLKMDCEGAEFAIFDNMPKATMDAFGRMAVEFHDGRHREIHDHMTKGGFKIIDAEDGEVGLIKGVRQTA